MPEENHGPVPNFTDTVSELVAAYVSNNHVASSDLPTLIRIVSDAVAGLAAPQASAPAEPVEMLTPAQIRRSIQHDGIISFLDGKSYKTLKRHLKTFGLTPETYRQRFGLRDDYPMVAPSYSERRSSLAKALGLGVRGRAATDSPAPKRRRQAA